MRDNAAAGTIVRSVLLVLVVSCALWIYRPWVDLGFDLADFSEIRSILDSAPDFSSRYHALSDYYAGHGRWNALTYALLSLKWDLFGPNPVYWQWLRFGQMLTVGGLLALALRRFHVHPTTGVALAGLYLFCGAAAMSFVRLTMAEVLAVQLLLMLVYLSSRFRESSNWWALCLVIGLVTGALIAAKEVFVALVPFGLLPAFTWRDGEWTLPRLERRHLCLIGTTALTIAVLSIPILSALDNSNPEGFASSYGVGRIGLIELSAIAVFMGLPVHREVGSDVSLAHPANVAFVIFLFAGTLLFRAVRGRRNWLPAAWCGLTVIAGAAIYMPWPFMAEFYALPFFLGSVGLAALAAQRVRVATPRKAYLADVIVLFIVLLELSPASALAQTWVSQRVVFNRVATALRSREPVGRVVVQSRTGGKELGAALLRVAGIDETALIPLRCADSIGDAYGASVVINYPVDCGGRPDTVHVRHVRSFSWSALQMRSDSIAVGISYRSPHSDAARQPP